MPTVTLNATDSGYMLGNGGQVQQNDLYSGYASGKGGSFAYAFAVKWDVSSIPSNAVVSSAYFEAYATLNTCVSGQTFNVYEATSAWENYATNVTYGAYNYNTHDPWGTGTGSYRTLVPDSANFRTLVTNWISGGTNHGLASYYNGGGTNGYAVYSGGTSKGGGSNYAHLTVTYSTPKPPNVPTGLNSSSVLATSATVAWTAPAVDGTHDAATQYSVQRATNSTFTTGLASYGPFTTSQSFTGLTPGTTYWVRVAAINADGTSAYTASINFTTLASQTVIPTGAPSAQAFNIVTIKAKKTISPTGAPSLGAVNPVTIAKKNYSVQPGIPSAEAFNAVTIVRGAVTAIPTGAPSAEAFGLPTFNRVFRVTLVGAPSAEAFTAPVIVRGAVTAVMVGIPSAQAFNPVTIQAKTTVVPTGAPSAQVVNAVALLKKITLALVGAPSAQAVNPVIVLPGSRTITLVGAPSLEAFGIPRYNVKQTVVLLGVPSAQAVNAVALLKRITLLPPSIPSAGVVNPIGNFLFGSVTVYPTGVPSGEEFGTIFVVKIVTYVSEGVPSGELRIAPSGFIIILNAPVQGGLLVEDQPRLVMLSQPLPEGGLVVLSQYDPIDSGVEV